MEEHTPGQSNEFVRPESVIALLDLKKGDHVADFGAGHGYFTLPIARAVGSEGKVYALDVQKSVLDVIRSRAKLVHLLNIECIWADLENPGGSKLKDAFVEFVIMANIAFQAETKDTIFKEAYRILRPGGRIASYGATTGPVKEFVLRSLFWKQVTLLGTTMGSPREFEAMLALYDRGGLRPVVDRVLPLEEAAAAHRRMEEAGQFGKLVLRI